MTFEPKKIKAISLHTTLFIPGHGQWDKNINPMNAKGLKMEWHPDGVYFFVTSKDTPTGTRGVIPIPTVASVIFEDEDPKALKKVK